MNKTNKGANTNTVQMILDAVICIIIYVFFYIIFPKNQEKPQAYLAVLVAFTFIYLISNKEAKLYDITTFYYKDRIFKYMTKSFLIAVSITAAMLFCIGDDIISRKFFITYLIVVYLCLLIEIYSFHFLHRLNNGKNGPRVLFVGKIGDFDKYIYFINKTNMKLFVVGYVSTKEEEEKEYLGKIENLEEILHKYHVDEICFMQNSEQEINFQPYIDICIERGITVRIVMNYYKATRSNSYVSSVGTYPVLTYHTISLNNYEAVLKRVMDIIGALAGIILSSPFMIITAILIKLDSPGPVIFKQTRIGMNGREFKMLKFRTMYQDAEARKKELMNKNEVKSGLMFKMKDDPRITKLGKVLRKTSIDELPQFFNVLMGQMSLVGTRPPTIDEVEQYNRNHWRRISIKPGITGMWQISGRSDITDFEKVVQLDTYYIDRWNILLDFKIILLTVAKLFGHSGAY